MLFALIFNQEIYIAIIIEHTKIKAEEPTAGASQPLERLFHRKVQIGLFQNLSDFYFSTRSIQLDQPPYIRS
jgi:hypothetical protein